MKDVVDLALSLPTVIFTITTIFFLGFWLTTTLIGSGMDALDDLDFDLDGDVDVDVDVDTDVDVDGHSSGLLRGALDFLGITGMPILLALNLLSLFAWVISMIFMAMAGDVSGGAAIAVGLLVFAGSFLAGGFITGRIATRFSHVLTPTFALRRRELVGSVCTITTQRVSGDFGQAEVRDAEGGSLIVQVRCVKDNDLGAGDRALIFDLDAENGVFHISPDRGLVP